MATERQIEANRKNAAKSTGPKTEAGKARSRANATKHGLAAESIPVDSMKSSEFQERRAKWAASLEPVDEAAEWALDRAVAASFRIEQCEQALDEFQATSRERARYAWDLDRAVEAAKVFNRLARDPVLASRQLQTTFAGVELVIQAWQGLDSTLQGGADWSDAEVSRALDLLGIPLDRRAGKTEVSGPDGLDLIRFRKSLVRDEIERLEALRDEALAPLEDIEQRQAVVGDVALLSKPARLLLRYERDAWKRYRDSIDQVRNPAPTPEPEPIPAPIPPAPPVVNRPVASAKPERPASDGRSFEEERRMLQAMVAPLRSMFADQAAALGLGLDDDPEWLDALERRLDAEGSVTERTRFQGPAHQSSDSGKNSAISSR